MLKAVLIETSMVLKWFWHHTIMINDERLTTHNHGRLLEWFWLSALIEVHHHNRQTTDDLDGFEQNLHGDV